MAAAEPVVPRVASDGAGPEDDLSIPESSETLNSSAVSRIMIEFLIYFGKAFAVFYPVYLTGYLGFSISWVLLCMVMITWWKKNRQCKDTRIGTAIEFVEDETNMIHKELLGALQMASWVQISDVEKADWINKVFVQAWPFFGMYMEKLLKEKIQQTIRDSNSALKMFTFTKIHFGHVPVKITGIKAYTSEVDQKEVILDLNINYVGDVTIQAVVKPALTAGVKELKLRGMLRVILGPLTDQVPLVGGVTLFFIRRPTLQIDWTGTTNILDSPAFNSLSQDTVMDHIASLMVLPNRMCIPLIDQVKADQMRFPLPRGVVRVHLLEAKDLVAKDTYMMGLVKGKSDPYTKLRVGDRHYQSKTIKQNLDPVWNEVYEFVVHEAPGQELEMELYDEDTDKDDFLGKYNLDLGEVKREKEIDESFTLEGIESGKVHLKLQWFSLKTDSSLLKESEDGLSCAMLAVYLDSASNLPKNLSEITERDHHKQGKQLKQARLTKRNPNSFVEFAIGKDVQKSKVVHASKDPVWEEGFTFFVHNVKTQQLIVQVKDFDKKSQLGVITLPLSRLLNISNMSLDQGFPLERSGANSQIKLKATLRILNLEKPPPKQISNPPQQVKHHKPQTNQANNGSVPTSSAGTVSSLPPPSAATVSSLPPPSAATVSSLPPPSKNIAASQATSQVPAKAAPQVSSQASAQASTQAASPIKAGDSQNGSSGDFSLNRRGSFVASETYQSSSSKANMRRYDSHSLLSENSIASSRFDISEGVMYPEAIRNHQGSFGEIHLTIRHANLRNKLIVLVKACRNLFPCSESGTDSYVRLYLLPDQTWRHRRKTNVKKNTVNPVFNEKFEFNVPLEETQRRKLDVAVKNNKMFHTRERKDIGMVTLDLSQINLVIGVTEWFELTIPGLKKAI